MTIALDTVWTPQRDRWGRPLIIPPEGGKPVGYTRATTVAKTLDDEGSLTAWAQRMTAAGLARRPDLLALIAASLDNNGDIPADKRDTIQKLCDEAKEVGGGSRAANLGTALHALTEQYDLGQTPPFVPEQFAADIDAYRRTVEPFEVVGVEQFVVLDDHQIGGTFDRLWRLPDGRLVIADLKTGQNLDYSWRAISVQLAIYANSVRYHDGIRTPLGDIDTDTGIVIHLPVGSGHCTLHQVDLRAGLVALQHSMWARNWRKRRDLHTPFPVPASPSPGGEASPAPAAASTESRNVPEGAAPAREQLANRIRTISDLPGGKDWLRLHWPTDIPTLKKSADHTVDQLTRLEQLCADAERDLALPFTDNDRTRTVPAPAVDTPVVARPDWVRPDDGPALDDRQAAALKAEVNSLPPDVRAFIATVFRDAQANGRPITVDRQHTERSKAISRAAATAAACLHDRWRHDTDYLRVLLAAAIGCDPNSFPATVTGAAFATLTIDQANTLAHAFEQAYNGDEIGVTFATDGTPCLVLDTNSSTSKGAPQQ